MLTHPVDVSEPPAQGPGPAQDRTADRDAWARRALQDVEKILTLQDRNPHSPTYGCFDRNFWHFRMLDFPSGMAQEFVWPLALAYTLDLPDNPYKDSEAVREWIEAGLDFAMNSSHADGSCDDYFPYERATGAAAFSLLACLDSYSLLKLDRPDLIAFFERRAAWLGSHRESGRLSNHEALIVACLVRLSQLTGATKWEEGIRSRLARLLSWQTEEGWFYEYEGCDPGYLSLTISLLGMLDQWRPDLDLRSPISRAVGFAREMIHPDGTYGGEYGSRNTYNFFPHGFELAGRWMPEALAVNDLQLAGLEAGLQPCYSDDHVLGHHAWNYLLAWRDHVAERPPLPARPEGRRWFAEAKLLIDRRNGQELYLAANKGGVLKYFRDGKLILSDTQVSLRTASGRTAVAHMIGPNDIALGEDEIIISGDMGWAKQTQMTVSRLMLLRAVMLTGGRLFPNAVRKLLQKMLISGKKPAPYRFRRTLRLRGRSMEIDDRIEASTWTDVADAGIGAHQTSIYVVMSRVFARGQLQSWIDLTPTVRGLADGEPLTLIRVV